MGFGVLRSTGVELEHCRCGTTKLSADCRSSEFDVFCLTSDIIVIPVLWANFGILGGTLRFGLQN